MEGKNIDTIIAEHEKLSVWCKVCEPNYDEVEFAYCRHYKGWLKEALAQAIIHAAGEAMPYGLEVASSAKHVVFEHDPILAYHANLIAFAHQITK